MGLRSRWGVYHPSSEESSSLGNVQCEGLSISLSSLVNFFPSSLQLWGRDGRSHESIQASPGCHETISSQEQRDGGSATGEGSMEGTWCSLHESVLGGGQVQYKDGVLSYPFLVWHGWGLSLSGHLQANAHLGSNLSGPE